ncbi:MAG: hypothetical protein EA365_14125 [Gloeocapsa sp. DLM2.Bin57]|nr:MAG: hypothetical protein EA365_14125 [Gloeocapsa sp. DLM2.Bin57]
MARAFNRRGEDIMGKMIFKRFIQKLDPNLFEEFVNVVNIGNFLVKNGQSSLKVKDKKPTANQRLRCRSMSQLFDSVEVC